jgi:hypothetical protein
MEEERDKEKGVIVDLSLLFKCILSGTHRGTKKRRFVVLERYSNWFTGQCIPEQCVPERSVWDF